MSKKDHLLLISKIILAVFIFGSALLVFKHEKLGVVVTPKGYIGFIYILVNFTLPFIILFILLVRLKGSGEQYWSKYSGLISSFFCAIITLTYVANKYDGDIGGGLMIMAMPIYLYPSMYVMYLFGFYFIKIFIRR